MGGLCWDRVSLCCPDYLRTFSADQAVSASWVLGLNVCTTIPGCAHSVWIKIHLPKTVQETIMPSVVLFVVVHVSSCELLILWFSMVLWILLSRFLCLLSSSVEPAITLPLAFVMPAYLPRYQHSPLCSLVLSRSHGCQAFLKGCFQEKEREILRKRTWLYFKSLGRLLSR